METNDASAIRILCVDDHPLMREGIAALIAAEPDLSLEAEAGTGDEAVAQYRAVRPDITLMDIQMPQTNGVDAISSIRAEFPQARVIVLTTYAGDVLAQRALKAGASAYLLKSMVRKQLVETIRAVHRGERRVAWEVAVGLAQHMTDSTLTTREVEVLALIAAGNSNKLIARQLSITEGTAKTHVKSVLAKLSARDRTHAATLGRERGIIGV